MARKRANAHAKTRNAESKSKGKGYKGKTSKKKNSKTIAATAGKRKLKKSFGGVPLQKGGSHPSQNRQDGWIDVPSKTRRMEGARATDAKERVPAPRNNWKKPAARKLKQAPRDDGRKEEKLRFQRELASLQERTAREAAREERTGGGDARALSKGRGILRPKTAEERLEE